MGFLDRIFGKKTSKIYTSEVDADAATDIRAVEPFKVPELKAALVSGGYLERKRAAQALGEIGDPIAIDILSFSLRDPDFEVRKCAIEALGKIKDPNAAKSLISALGDPNNREMAEHIAKALGNIGDPIAIEPLTLFANSGPRYYVGAYVAIEALGKINDPKSLDALIEIHEKHSFSITSSALEVSKSFLELGDIRAIKPLLNVYSIVCGNKEAEEKISDAIKNLNVVSLIELLVQLLVDKDKNIRFAAAVNLEKMGWAPKSDLEKCNYWIADKKWPRLISQGNSQEEPIIEMLNLNESEFTELLETSEGKYLLRDFTSWDQSDYDSPREFADDERRHNEEQRERLNDAQVAKRSLDKLRETLGVGGFIQAFQNKTRPRT
jgi:HEAT repeat protein